MPLYATGRTLFEVGGRSRRAALLWEPRDLWVGAFLDPENFGHAVRWRLYVILVPCFPVRLEWWTRGGAR